MSRKPSNHADFLGFLFKTRPDDARVAIAWQDTKSDGKVVYPVSPWPDATAQDFHTHYSVGVFTPTDAAEGKGKFRRRKTSWLGACLLLLEDVGEEKDGVTIGTPDVEPTFKIQTKPGSQQWGFVFERLVTDMAWFDRLELATVAAGINDPGGQNVIRLARLPGSQPIGKKHRAELIYWSGRRFAAESLPDALGLDMDAVAERRSAGFSGGETGDYDDAVLDWLFAQGMVLASGDGFYDIICPWSDQHTDGETAGTGYSPANPYRSFHCFHRCGDPNHPQGGKDTNAFLLWVAANGGPDVETLHEDAVAKRREEIRQMTDGADCGSTHPVTRQQINAVRAATTKNERQKALSHLCWRLVAEKWSEAEIIKEITPSLDEVDAITRMIRSAKTKQDRARQRDQENVLDDLKRAALKLNEEQVVDAFIAVASLLKKEDVSDAVAWLRERDGT